MFPLLPINPIGFTYGMISFALLNLTFLLTNKEHIRLLPGMLGLFAVTHCLTQTPRDALKGVGVSQGLVKSVS